MQQYEVRLFLNFFFIVVSFEFGKKNGEILFWSGKFEGFEKNVSAEIYFEINVRINK